MVSTGLRLPNPEKSEYRVIIQRLRGFLSAGQLATILGCHPLRLNPSDKQGISLAHARLGYMWLRLMESPHIPISPIEIICLGKWETFYDPAADKITQENLRIIKEISENVTQKRRNEQTIDSIGEYEI